MIPARLPTSVKQAPKLLPIIKPNKNPCIVASESICCVKLGCCMICVNKMVIGCIYTMEN